MNKILIVGHPQSGYADVERLLRARGMAPAQPSRREGFAPEQISDTLCKAHSAAPLHLLGHEREVQQIDVAPVWQGLAMDLMLGNIDQPLWGWADPKAVHLLDHWRQLDPTLHFILVYDRPHSVITRSGLQEAATLTREALQQRVDAWSAYNAAVLGFHLRHPDRSLLVHSEQVRRSSEATLQQVRERIDAPWKDRLAGPAQVEDARPGAQTPAVANDNDALDASALSTLVAGALLKDQPGSQALYEELQASANLPLEADLAHGEDPALGMEAWLSMVAQQEAMQNQRELTRQLQVGREQAERLAQERERLIEQERQLRLAEQADMARQLALVRQERERVEAAQAGSQQENELLLDQLHQVQEELERYHLSGQEQSRRIEALQQQDELNAAALAQARQQAQTRIAALTADIDALRVKLAEPPVPTVDPALSEENEVLLHQLHQVQEELERYYLENQRLKAGAAPAPKRPEPQPQPLYGAADRVKQQLSYRLGARMIAQSRSMLGWMTMPWALMGEVRRYRALQRQSGDARLPPIHTYRDAEAAERVKQHLSYRLGQTFIAHSRSPVGWLRLPFALRRELKQFAQRKQVRTPQR